MCVDISEIKVFSSTKNCYEHLPIQFNYTSKLNKSKILNGFLTTKGIIRLVSREVICDESSQYFSFKNSNLTIRKISNNYSVLQNISFEELDASFKYFESDLDHDNLLVNGVNNIENSASINIINEMPGDYYINKPITSQNSRVPVAVKIDTMLRSSVENLYLFLTFFIAIGFITILITVIICCGCKGYCNCCKKELNEIKQDNNMIKMDKIHKKNIKTYDKNERKDTLDRLNI